MIELTDKWYTFDRRNPLYVEREAIGTCDICHDYIYEDEPHTYIGVYDIVHDKCNLERIRYFISKYMHKRDFQPKRFTLRRF